MNLYSQYDFANWGDGNYEKRLVEITKMFYTADPRLLCIFDDALSKKFVHYLNPNINETVVYLEPLMIGYWQILKNNNNKDYRDFAYNIHEFIMKTAKVYKNKYLYN